MFLGDDFEYLVSTILVPLISLTISTPLTNIFTYLIPDCLSSKSIEIFLFLLYHNWSSVLSLPSLFGRFIFAIGVISSCITKYLSVLLPASSLIEGINLLSFPYLSYAIISKLLLNISELISNGSIYSNRFSTDVIFLTTLSPSL